MREHPGLDARLDALSAADRVFVCSITRGEVAYGIGRLPDGKKRQALEAKAQRLYAVFSCEPVPVSAGDHYARAKLARQRNGLPLDENDLWIAATTLALGATLVMRDNDFQHIDGLAVENWSV